MHRLHLFLPMALAALLGLGGCATAPANPPITCADPAAGYRFQTREQYARDKEDLVVLAFSGGGTRAAAFSYGVLEALRNTEVTRVPNLEVYVINVSFAELKDATERAYLNEQPTSFVLPPEAVDRLRAAAGRIVLESPDFQQYLKDLGGRILRTPTPADRFAPAP